MLNIDWLPPLIYGAIGVFFGELSLKHHPQGTSSIMKVFTYVVVIVTWPYVVYLAMWEGRKK